MLYKGLGGCVTSVNKSVLKQGSAIFLTTGLIIATIVSVILKTERDNEINQLRLEEDRLIQLHKQTILREFDMLFSHLLIVNSHYQFNAFMEKADERDKTALAG